MAAPLDHTMLGLTFERYPDGAEFPKVPPHITVLPWFTGRKGVVDYIVRTTCEQTSPFGVYLGEPGQVGAPGYEKDARFVQSTELLKFHKQLFYRLRDEGVQFSHQGWLGDGYNPHFRAGAEEAFMADGDTRIFSHLAVIQNLRTGVAEEGTKSITTIELGD